MHTYRLRYSSVKHSGYKEHPFINIPTKIGLSKKKMAWFTFIVTVKLKN